jgi:hypothetical protein
MSNTRAVEERWSALVTFYREASTQVSSIIRQLTFAGFAFAWLFHVDLIPGGGWSIPTGIGWAIAFLVLSLLIDLCQYVVTSFSADRALNAGISPDLPPRHLDLMHGLWWAKVITTLVGFVILFGSAFSQFQFR